MNEERITLADGPAAGRSLIAPQPHGCEPATEVWVRQTTQADRATRVWFRYVRVGAGGVWRWDPGRLGTTLPDTDWFTVGDVDVG